jgi:hypothetical protein
MTVEQRTTTEQVAARPGLVQALRIIAPLLTLVVLVQAVFAGRGLFINSSNIDIHGGLGMVTALLVVVQTALVFTAGFQGRTRAALVGHSLALLALVVVQLALGYSGRESGGQAAAWHVPNGVIIFGLTVSNASYIFRLLGGARTG